jgi:hypothetical protein
MCLQVILRVDSVIVNIITMKGEYILIIVGNI